LILLDVSMPEMNGYEVCEQLKAEKAWKDIPVIFISALSETIDKVKAFRVGGVDYVTKPFHFEEVYARVQTHLNLRRLEKLHDDLTRMIVHDLRNPLTGIYGALEVLRMRDGLKLSDSCQNLITAACRSAAEMRDLITSLLDVGKMEAGEMQLQREPCNLGDLIGSIREAVQPLPGSRTMTFDPPATPLIVMVDVSLLRRVLQNLIGNAIKYTPFGGNVRVLITPFAGEVRIDVIDAGPGIAREHHQRIFEKFGQVADGRNRQGTGLGLTFCQMAVEAHGGRIGVESEVGKGSTFWLVLPAAGHRLDAS
jgi:signal transduction histidine kinase